jgi:hypothetical protein
MKLLSGIYSMRVVFNEREEESKVPSWAIIAGDIREWNGFCAFGAT